MKTLSTPIPHSTIFDKPIEVRFYVATDQNEITERKTGRPLFDGKNEALVLAKLQYAFTIGGSVKEACSLADISTDSFYRYCKRYPDFRNKIEGLQTTPTLLARMTIFKSLQDGNVKTAQWHLERKCPEEFSPSGSFEWALRQKDQEIERLRRLLVENDIVF
jgi:hypothetical protein